MQLNIHGIKGIWISQVRKLKVKGRISFVKDIIIETENNGKIELTLFEKNEKNLWEKVEGQEDEKQDKS